MKKLVKILCLSPMLVLLMAQSASACASCMGQADEKLAPAMNAAMGLLLTLVFAVACLFVYFLFFLAKRDGLSLDEDHNLGLGATPSSHQ